MRSPASTTTILTWLLSVLVASGAGRRSEQAPFPTMASAQGRMPCGSCNAPATIAWQGAIAPPSEPGERLVVSGTIYQPDGTTPAPGITLFVYHTDSRGHYNTRDDPFDPRLYGWVRTGADGRYEFRTIRPGPYPALSTPAHIHVHVYGPGRPEWFIPEYWFAGDPLIPARDRDLPVRLGRFSPIVPLTRDGDGTWRGQRDIRLDRPSLK